MHFYLIIVDIKLSQYQMFILETHINCRQYL